MIANQLITDFELTPLDLGRFAALRVLAADDHPYNREILRCLLGLVGVEPEIVEDGEELVSAWSSGVYDIVLTDVEMPRMNGLVAAQEIRRQQSRLGETPVPILAITANADGYSPDVFRAHGLSAVLPKPIRPQSLFATMLSAVDRAARPDQSALREERSFGARRGP